MIKLSETIVVEGKYDKIKLSSIVDANIITTDGFGIFNNRERLALIRKLSEKSDILIMTDSDSAGARIRSFLKGVLKPERIKNIYIPEILGKEKRKREYSRQSLLGVEGMGVEIIIEVLKKFGITEKSEKNNESESVTKADFYRDKLSGHENSSQNRQKLCKALDIPVMPSNSLLRAVNLILSRDEYEIIIKELNFDDIKQ